MTEEEKRKQWFAVHVLAGQENKVYDSLTKRVKTEEMSDFIYEIVLPTERVSEIKRGKKTETTRKFFPGYLIVNMYLLDDNKQPVDRTWYFIRETQGIIGFVGGERPVAVMPEEIAVIKEQISDSEDTEKPKVNFEIGETIKINDGPFLNFSGVIEEIEPDRGKLKVTVNIFGRNTPVELEYWQVEKA